MLPNRRQKFIVPGTSGWFRSAGCSSSRLWTTSRSKTRPIVSVGCRPLGQPVHDRQRYEHMHRCRPPNERIPTRPRVHNWCAPHLVQYSTLRSASHTTSRTTPRSRLGRCQSRHIPWDRLSQTRLLTQVVNITRVLPHSLGSVFVLTAVPFESNGLLGENNEGL